MAIAATRGDDHIRLLGSLGRFFGGRGSSVSSFGRGVSSAFGSSFGAFSGCFDSGFGAFSGCVSIGFGVSGHGIDSFFGFGGGFAAASSEAESRGGDGGSENDLTHGVHSFFSE
jgi:hypothetical protein